MGELCGIRAKWYFELHEGLNPFYRFYGYVENELVAVSEMMINNLLLRFCVKQIVTGLNHRSLVGCPCSMIFIHQVASFSIYQNGSTL